MALLTALPHNFQQPIRSLIAEAHGLSWFDLAPVMVHYQIQLDATNGLEGDVDYYRVPQGRKLLVWEMRPHLGMNAISEELVSSDATSLLSIAGVRNRELVKAMNARVSLRQVDMDKREVILTDVRAPPQKGVSLPLSTLYHAGSVKWVKGNDIAPLIVRENDRLECGVRLTSVTAVGGETPAGASTEYGVTLIGALIRQSAT